MNKQELIEKLRSDLYLTPDNQFREGYNNGVKNSIILVKELKEIKKPVVPQFVADWYESHKRGLEWNLRHLGLDMMNGVFDDTEMHDWLNNTDNKPFETLVKMKLYGYEVEKEKLYRARHKLTGEYLSQNYAKTGYYHGLDHFHILKLSKKDWEELGVFDDKVYEIEEAEE